MFFSKKEVIQKIAEEHGTPFYLYDAHVLTKSFLALRDASPVMFLSHGFPSEILYRNGKISLIRERFDEIARVES